MLKRQLLQDLNTALKEKQAEKVSALRYLLAQLQNAEIKKREASREELSDEEVIAVLKSEVKKRLEAIALFRQGGRDDLVQSEEAELKVVQSYLPAELSREEVLAVVKRLTATHGDSFNSLMKAAMAELKGQASGQMVSEVVKEVLQ